MIRKDLYRKEILAGIPRVLTEEDRDPFSITYGSFDREYWAWATKDFSNIDLQRAIYPLTLLYLNAFEGNVWFREPKIKDWIWAGFKCWARVQHRDGSFDHHYPNEFSFVGVAFTLYEISQAFFELKNTEECTEEDKEQWISVLKIAADFLCDNDELHGFISNHRAGAACALYSMFLITGDQRYKKRAYFFIDSIREKMSKKEGWLYEYGGPDPGYQTLATYYLSNFYRLSGDEEILSKIVIPSVRYLIYFFHPDGSVGGEYGSRNCPLYFPSGFEILSEKFPEAEAIAQTGAYGVENGNSPSLMSHDIRNFVPMLSSYTQALIVCLKKENVEPSKMPFEEEFEKYWQDSKIYIRSDRNLYSIIGCSKGGVIKVFDKAEKKIVASHCGYMIEFTNGKYYTNQFLDFSMNPIIKNDFEAHRLTKETILSLYTPLYLVTYSRIMTPFRFFLFRLFNLTIGRIRLLNNWIRYYIITGIFIRRKVALSTGIHRRIIFSDTGIRLEDDLGELKGKHMRSVRASGLFTCIYMGSSKYYRNSEKLKDNLSKINFQKIFYENRRLVICYTIDSHGMSYKVN